MTKAALIPEKFLNIDLRSSQKGLTQISARSLIFVFIFSRIPQGRIGSSQRREQDAERGLVRSADPMAEESDPTRTEKC